MKVCKSQCSVFKDFYEAYSRGKAEKETMDWMREHEKECSYCSKWTLSREAVNKSDNDKDDESKESFEEVKSAVKKVRLAMYGGLGVIIFIAMWMSSAIRI